MQFICLLGITGSGKSTIEKYFESLGYKRSVSYTTRKPQVHDGVQEVDGNEYRFVSVEKFMNLVNKEIIIEYENYSGNFYGTPEPFGATRYVAVVCLNGYKALKEKYGKQVIGVYLKVSDEVAIARATSRDRTAEQVLKRIEQDKKLLSNVESVVDITVDGTLSKEAIVSKILTLTC